MVKEVVRWETKDGNVFDCREEALKWEDRENKLSLIRRELHRDPSEDEIYDFINEYTKGWK